MGYYSDVRVSTTQEGFAFLKENATGDLIGGYGYVEPVNDGDGVVFGWDAVKWYSSFHEVAEFENLLAVMGDKGIPYEFLAVGEDGATDASSSGDWGSDKELKHHIGARTIIEVWEG